MNPNDVEIVRVYTREASGLIGDMTPHLNAATGFTFDVVVEAESGTVVTGSGAPYAIRIDAFDLTTGNAPTQPIFSQTHNGNFIVGPWPSHREIFQVPLPLAADRTAVRDHIFRFVASLVTPPPVGGAVPQIVSFAESPLFMIIVPEV